MVSQRIAGFGLVNKDIVAVVPSWERDAKVTATHLFEQVGGPVPVALMAMARLGENQDLTFFGVTGEDSDANDLQTRLQTENVTPQLTRTVGKRTSRSLVFLDARDGSRTLANYAEELPPMIVTDAERAFLREQRLLHLDGRDLPASLEMARVVREGGGLVSLDLGTMRPGREELMARCDIVIASKKGGAGAFPDVADDPTEQVRRFLQLGVKVAGVTLAERGVVIGEAGSEPVHLPAYRVPDVVDTCGAGDLFHGAFLQAYLTGKTVVECADFAQAAVAVRIPRYGNHAGLPTLAEVESIRNRNDAVAGNR